MATKSESKFANFSPPPLPQNYDKNEPAVSLPKGLGTDGLASSIGAQPSTPRFNPKNTSIITPEHTPPQSLRPSSSSSLPNPTTYSTDPDLEYLLSLNNLSLSNTPILPRDRYDLNATRSSSHPHNHILNRESEDLRTHYKNLEFYQKWTSHLISKLTGIPMPRYLIFTSTTKLTNTTPQSCIESLVKNDDSHSFPPRADYSNELTIITRQKKLLRENDLAICISELEALTTRLITLPFPLPHIPQNEENNTDTLLYRLHTATSKSTYSRSYGFRCPGWIDSLYTSGVTSERQKNGRAFQAHCNATHDPSPYISVSTSIARIMRLSGCQKGKEAGSRVFVISLNRLRQLGIKAQSTEIYLKDFVGSAGNKGENRVSYVTDTHWLVEEWIPDQAIVSEMDCGQFLEIADREGISWEEARNYRSKTFKAELEPRKIDLEKWPKRYLDGKN
ncbi:hypothetical protein BGAL_0125g00200 [Botrytis galanthina]|uniref:DUF7587 domain-containing protein n=1 Tax=Botrytis galanthina TaxID=278940 RepID=A0A4S8QZZ6_9HELO|nr:hypothetical protein BGAL_0125g00200 [Botrytis galanthina]